MSLRIVSLLLLASTLLLAACQSPLSLAKPDITLSSVDIKNVGLFEQQWQVNLRVTNPNDRGLTLKSLDYTLFVDDQKLATGMNHEAVTIPARSDQLVSTTITTSLLQTLNGFSKAKLGSSALPYRIEGVARLGGWPLPVSFSHKSELALPATF